MLTDFAYGLLDVIFWAIVKFRCMKFGFDKILIFHFFFVLKFATHFSTDYICDWFLGHSLHIWDRKIGRKFQCLKHYNCHAINFWDRFVSRKFIVSIANLRSKKRSQISWFEIGKLVANFCSYDRFIGFKFATDFPVANPHFRSQKSQQTTKTSLSDELAKSVSKICDRIFGRK